MTAYLLALLSAGLYGSADFLGGLASRRASTLAIVAVSQLAGLALLLALLPLLPAATPQRPDLTFGALAGVAGGTGVALLYQALAVGTMGVVAPTTAVCAVAIPVLAAVALGERPGATASIGIVLAILSIILVSQQAHAPSGDPSSRRSGGRVPRGLGLALVSGVAIGLFFLALARTSAAAGLWPLVAARTVSVALFTLIGVAAAQSFRMGRDVLVIALAGGALDMLANAVYLYATRYGPLAIVVTLASLYPASTVILARIVLRERLGRVQIAGIVCALAAVSLIVGSG